MIYLIEDTPVYFRIRRDRKTGEPGAKEFWGIKTFRQVVDDLMLMEHNRDRNGRFCKPYLADCDGNVVSTDNPCGIYGYADIDGAYNTHYVKMLSECYEEELQAIARDNVMSTEEVNEWVARKLDRLSLM